MKAPKLSTEEREKQGHDFLDRLAELTENSGHHEFCNQLEDWDRQWQSKMPRYNKPWEHASDYNPPMTFAKVEDVHAVLFSFFSNFSFFSMAAAEKQGQAEEILRERGETWTEYLRWSMQNQACVMPFIDQWLHDGTQYGTAIGYMPWLRLVRNYQTEHPVPADQIDFDELTQVPAGDVLIGLALAGKLLDKPTRRRGKGQDGYNIRIIDDDGKKKDAVAFIDTENPHYDDPVVVVERERCYYNAPAPKCIAPWDFIVGANVTDLQTAERFFVLDRLSYNQIANLQRTKLFNLLTDKDLALIKDESELGAQPTQESYDLIDIERDERHGRKKLQATVGEIAIVYEYCFEDVDGDGYAESIVRVIANIRKPILLMQHRIDYLYPHGRRPFFDWRFVPVDHRYYGMGIPEIMFGTQVESNTWYQVRSDVLEIVSKPAGFYDPMMGFAPEELTIVPGTLIKARSPQQAFAPLTFPVDPSPLFREQNAAEAQAEKTIGSTDVGLGRHPSRPNAPRTLGGTAIAVRQQQVRTDVYLKRALFGNGQMTSGIKEFLHQYHELCAAFMPAQTEFRALGTDELREVSRGDLQGRFDFIIDFGEGVNNPQIRAQNATVRYQNALQNPLIQQQPQAMWQITVDFFEATGMKNASRVLKPPQPHEEHPPMPQEEENIVMSKGMYIDVLPSDNHSEHLIVIQQLMQDPTKLGANFEPGQMAMLNRHVQRHMEFLQMAAQMQGSATQGGGAETSGQMAPLQTGQTNPELASENQSMM